MRKLTDEEKNMTAGARMPESVSIVAMSGLLRQQVDVTTQQLGAALFVALWERLGKPDTQKQDWTTDDYGNTCIAGDLEWFVSCDPNIATLVDAANILMSGEPLKVQNI